jgi:HK97 family phage major capsid protein/HK97 family phage prohead protease
MGRRNPSDIIFKSGYASPDDPLEFVMSTESKDRMGDIIEQSGWNLREFKKNPIALFQHDHRMPIGTWENVRVEGKKLIGRLKLAKEGTSQIVDDVRRLIEQGILKAVSVGFSAQEYEPLEKDDAWGPLRFKKVTLLETSVVSVPANAEALAVAKGLTISNETRRLLLKSASVEGAKERLKRGVSAVPKKPTTRGLPMKLGEKIQAAEERLEELRESVSDIVKSAEDEGRDLTDEEATQIEELEGQIEAAQKSINGLKSAEKALAQRAERKAGERSGVSFVPAKAKTDKPSDVLFKAAAVKVLAYQMKMREEDVLQMRYAHDPRVETFLKAATHVATTTAVGWAAELVDDALSGFINELTPVSIYGPLAAAGTAIPFGDANSVTIPRRAGLGKVAGSFVGENATIPVKQDQYGSVTFARYKAAVITTFTNELARVSNPQIEGLLRSAIVQDTGDMLDTFVMNPASAAVAGIRPASPWHGAANQASKGTTQAQILEDLRFLMDTLSVANAGRNSRLIMNPSRISGLSMLTNANGAFVFRDELAQGRLLGIPVIVSTNCPADKVYIIDCADFATAFGTPEFMVSDQATIVMADDDGVAPTMAATNAVNPAAGSINVSDAAGTTPPTVVRSMFQTWSTALRMVLPISWGMMRPGTAAYITGVAW